MSGDSSSSNDLSEYLNSETLQGGAEKFHSFRNRFKGYFVYMYLLLIMAFMVGVRLLPWDTFVTESKVYLSGNDGWYHIRQSMYVAENWPSTMPYDLLTGYPVGNDAGTFGTLFDQIVGTLALIIGLGNPDQYIVTLVLALITVAFSGMCAFPVYYITKKVSSQGAGVLAAAILALVPGLFLFRGLLGNGDHQMAEVFFLLVSLGAYYMAFTVARDNVFVAETLSRDTIRDATDELKYASVAGLAIGAYLLVWPPGIIFYAALGAFFALYATISAYSEDHLSEPILLVGAVSMIPPTLLLLLYLDSFGFGAAGYTALQVLLAAGVGIGCTILIVLQRLIDQRDLSVHTVPATVVAGSAAVFGSLAVGAPSAFDKIVFNIERTLLFGSGERTLTIAEAQQFVSLGNFFQPLFQQYGLMFVAGMVGFVLMAIMTALKISQNNEYYHTLFLLVFGLFSTLMAFTQIRFNYYFAPMVAIFAAYAIHQTFTMTDLHNTSVTSLKGYQIIVLVGIIILFIPGLIYPVGGTVVGQANAMDSIGSYQAWEEPLEWTADNTPDDNIETYGEYQKTDSPYADQAEGSYGVLSWWDYGHWISVTGDRSPVSNPFQQHAEESAEYLLATNESEAESSVQELNPDGDVNVEYVYVDWQMVNANSKFAAPVTWHPELNTSDTLEPIYLQTGNSVQVGTYLKTQRYYESLMVRLYEYHGSRAEPRPIVVDYDTTQLQTRDGAVQAKTFSLAPSSDSGIKKFDNMRQARQYVNNSSSAQIGGIGNAPPETVEALEHYRLVKTSERSALESRGYQASIQQTATFAQNGSLQYSDFTRDPSWVKVFENVDGAEVEGTGAPPNSTVTVVIQLQNPAQETRFSYTQVVTADENGDFTMTVPYSTTGYGNWGPENGHGNVEVKAIDSAKFYTVQQSIQPDGNGSIELNRTYYATEAHIPEGKVIGEDDESVTITLEQKSEEEMRELFTYTNQSETESEQG